MADVLVGGGDAFAVVGLYQRRWRAPLDHARELPGEVLGVLHAGIRAARAERRDLMGGVAGEDDPTLHEALEPPTLEGVDRDPVELEFPVPEHARDARDDVLGLLFFARVGIGAEPQIDAPDAVGLLVQQRRAAGMEGRVEPEPALRWVGFRHAHVRDQEALLERLAHEIESQHGAGRRARAVGRHHPVGEEFVGAVGRADGDDDAVVAGREADDLVAPTDLQIVEPACALHQEVFEVVLLQVDEGRHRVAGLRQEVEAVEQLLALKHPSELPGDAFLHAGAPDPETVEDLQRALGVTQPPRAFADPIGVVDEHHRHAALRQIDRRRKTDGTRADDDDRSAHRRPILVRRAAIGELVEGFAAVVGHRILVTGARCEVDRHPCRAAHISRSRSAVQMVGCSTPEASSKARETLKGWQCS